MRPRVQRESDEGAGPGKLSHGSLAGWGMAGEVTQGQKPKGSWKAGWGSVRNGRP